MTDDGRANEMSTEALREPARRVVDVGRETASRASEYLLDGLAEAASYAQDWSEKASEQIGQLTGRRLEGWTREVRGFVEQHPIKSLLITIGIGYLLGKLVRER